MSQGHIEAIRWGLRELQKLNLFSNSKKYYFHYEKVHFLGYIISSQKIRIEEKRIDAVKAWAEPKSI